nr:CRISPR-associated helicase Cas3' [Dehalococcoides mccartyi]
MILMEHDNKYYAHSIQGELPEKWQPLEAHLLRTAARARNMAAEFGCGEWGYLAGLWHDLGKYSSAFQNYLRTANDENAYLEGSTIRRVDHSTAGAIYAMQEFDILGRILAYQIVGHHAGLPDYEADKTGNAALSQRLKHIELFDEANRGQIPARILEQPFPKQKPKQGSDPAFWIRLLFSCLVDADFIDTEEFYDPGRTSARADYPTLNQLLNSFSKYMVDKQSSAPATQVNKVRIEILERCIQTSSNLPGIYTLTVPTGGGKTLSSMAFALNHAVKYSKRRIIYVIPYTSIIEQNAQQFRDIFGDSVVEHQSNLDTSDIKKDNTHSRLACENWDAPIIVTTSVQFFESLFASRTSRCRKLHNIVNSVVILDEAQLIPSEYLNPILHVLSELQKNYGVTLLLSTATQPALGEHKSFDFHFEGLPEMKEIIPNPSDLHNKLKRTEIHIPNDLNTPIRWDTLAAALKNHETVLCIVNRRDDCRTLWEKMPTGTFHLSALMCGAHRSIKIKEIRERLKNNIPTRVISTQLVEAGVDIDFPVVYRALAGLDSIAQAAGRCNREGRLKEKGKVIVFVPTSDIPTGNLRQARDIGKQLLSEECPDVLSPDRFEIFFRQLYWLKGEQLDKKGILKDLTSTDGRFSFRTVAMNFSIIDESKQASVVVMFGRGDELIKTLKNNNPDRILLRQLQRYVVNIPRYLHSELLASGAIEEIHPGIYVQIQRSMYNDNLGFCPEKFGEYRPDELIE